MSWAESMKDEINKRIVERLVQVGRDALEDAKITKTYENRTWDLVNAYGFGVVLYGNLVHIETAPDSSHLHIVEETEETIKREAFHLDGIYLILANGKSYASYLNATGHDVMSGAVLRAEMKLNR